MVTVVTERGRCDYRCDCDDVVFHSCDMYTIAPAI